jgi:hypothetical protein
MQICSTNTACFDFDLWEELSDVWLGVDSRTGLWLFYHDIVVTHCGQRDFDDCIVFGLRVPQRLPVSGTTLVERSLRGIR